MLESSWSIDSADDDCDVSYYDSVDNHDGCTDVVDDYYVHGDVMIINSMMIMMLMMKLLTIVMVLMMMMLLTIVMVLMMMMLLMMMMIGTMACLWCIKTQFIKRMSIAFHRWRLNSTMITWVLLNNITTTTTDNARSSDNNGNNNNRNNTSRSDETYDDDGGGGGGGVAASEDNDDKNIDVVNNDNGVDNDDDDDGSGNNHYDNGTITDAVQIALKIVDLYKTSSKSSPNKKKVIDIQSLLTYKGMLVSTIYIYLDEYFYNMYLYFCRV